MPTLGPSPAGLDPADKTNFNKMYLLWTHRIHLENKVNGKVPVTPAPSTPSSKNRSIWPLTTSQEIGFLSEAVKAMNSRDQQIAPECIAWDHDQKDNPKFNRTHHIGVITHTGKYRHSITRATTSNTEKFEKELISEIGSFRKQREHVRKLSDHPLGNSDVALYADNYVKSFGCGPFDKHQLLVNR
jgi:hypothetical protein